MRVSKIKDLQTTQKSRGWLEFWRFSDQKDRSDPSSFMKKIRTNETNKKFPKESKNYQTNFGKILKIDIADVINY